MHEDRAVIFDYDGLLVDTETAEFLAWQRLYSEQGGSLDIEVWKDAVGYDGAVNPRGLLELQIGKSLDWNILFPLKRRYHRELVDALPSLPGAAELVHNFAQAGWKIGAASNSSQEWVRTGLERLGLLRYFSALATRDLVANPKPLPDVYQLALANLGVPAERAVAFEDSEPGVRAAKAAGLFVVAVPNEFTKLQDLSLSNVVLPSLANLEVETVTAWGTRS